MLLPVDPSLKPSFTDRAPSILGVHAVRHPDSLDKPDQPIRFSHWNGTKWGRLADSPLEARPADSRGRGRPRLTPLLHCSHWEAQQGNIQHAPSGSPAGGAVAREIVGFLTEKGPQSFDVIAHGISGMKGEMLTRDAVDSSLIDLVEQGSVVCKAGYTGHAPENFFCLPAAEVADPQVETDESAALIEEATRGVLMPEPEVPAVQPETVSSAVQEATPAPIKVVPPIPIQDDYQLEADLELVVPVLRELGGQTFGSLYVEMDLRYPGQFIDAARLAGSMRAAIMRGLVKLKEVNRGGELSYVPAEAMRENECIYLVRPELPAITLEALIHQLLLTLRVNPPLRPLVLLDRLTHLFPQNLVTTVGVRAALQHCESMNLIVCVDKAYTVKKLAAVAVDPRFRATAEGVEIIDGQSTILLSPESAGALRALLNLSASA
ncbi:hypothetical protein ACOTHJ_13060 [Achromobacter xylosoxidans]